MRLICPNCAAQYKVAEDVIPDGGRDVQCSNCGHTWFETPGASEAAEMEASVEAAKSDARPKLAAVPDVQPDAEPQSEPEPAPTSQSEPQAEPVSEPEPESKPEPVSEAVPAAEIIEPASTPEPESEPAPKPREMAPDVADILREEAEFEQAARKAENTIETQPDLDLSHDPDEDRRSREARDRLSRLRGEPEIAAAVSAVIDKDADAPRSQLLPDIEEINSTLRHDAAAGSDTSVEYNDDIDAADKPSGFKRGFTFVIAIVLIALAVYMFAEQISAAVPQTEPALTSYVEWVDGMRIWLDAKVQGVIDRSGDAPANAVAPETSTAG